MEFCESGETINKKKAKKLKNEKQNNINLSFSASGDDLRRLLNKAAATRGLEEGQVGRP